MRLQKFMAKCGVASRRKSEEIILEGKVEVNGEIVTELGFKVDQEKDIVKIEGKILELEEEKIYIMLNKPTGFVTTVSDEFGRDTVIDLISDIEERVYPVGRLDAETSGLLILTNDGDTAYKVTHPKYEMNKKYIAKVKGWPTEQEIYDFRNGLEIEDYVTSKAKLKVLMTTKVGATLEIIIHEGKNRQVRKMCSKIGHPVIELKRVEVGKLKLGDLKEGTWRHLSNSEIDYLKN